MVCRGGRPLAEVEQNNGNRLGSWINSQLAPHQLRQLFMPPTKDNGELKIKLRQGAEDHLNYKQHKNTALGDTNPSQTMPRDCVNLLLGLRVCVRWSISR